MRQQLRPENFKGRGENRSRSRSRSSPRRASYPLPVRYLERGAASRNPKHKPSREPLNPEALRSAFRWSTATPRLLPSAPTEAAPFVPCPSREATARRRRGMARAPPLLRGVARCPQTLPDLRAAVSPDAAADHLGGAHGTRASALLPRRRAQGLGRDGGWEQEGGHRTALVFVWLSSREGPAERSGNRGSKARPSAANTQ